MFAKFFKSDNEEILKIDLKIQFWKFGFKNSLSEMILIEFDLEWVAFKSVVFKKISSKFDLFFVKKIN